MNQRLQTAEIFSNFKSNRPQEAVEWTVFDDLQPYEEILAAMEVRANQIARGESKECVWLLEHPALYTAGTKAQDTDLKEPSRFPVFQTGRGGEYTYHGPGQRVAYVMLDLKRRTQDVRQYVFALEEWLVQTLERFNIKAERREERVGVWVTRPEKPPLFDGSPAEDKIAALGIRLRKWVSFHGVSLNVSADLSHFEGIVPCGVEKHGITSLEDLGLLIEMPEVDLAMRAAFEEIFGATEAVEPIQIP